MVEPRPVLGIAARAGQVARKAQRLVPPLVIAFQAPVARDRPRTIAEINPDTHAQPYSRAYLSVS